ncbi:hypothetical protein HY311_00745 [Candidatus Nomurabacteria bacterium]|nr:hypothetical protein [Candidatus Nomurabacteria bacterium]
MKNKFGNKKELDLQEKEREKFLEWLETARDKDDELFKLFSNSMVIVFESIKDSPMKQSLQALLNLLWRMNSIKLGIFDECENDNMITAKALYIIMMEHWIKANYIFARLTSEKTDTVGQEYNTFCSFDEDVKYGNSLKWLLEILSSQESKKDPWDLLIKHRADLGKYSKEEIKKKSQQFNYREMVAYLLKNVTYAKNSFIEMIIPEYSELSSYIHGGPNGMSEMVSLSKYRFKEYKGMIRFTFNIHKINTFTSYSAFAQFSNKDFWHIVVAIKATPWIE